jgi:hypothetical protein
VKQSDLGEYEENAREKQNVQYTRQSTNSTSNQGKSQAPRQTKPYGWQTSSFKLKRVVTKTRGFSMQKTIHPLNPMRNTTSVKVNQRREFPLK